MANPHPSPFDRVARQKAASDLARMSHLSALDDGIQFAQRQLATYQAQLGEAQRTLDRLLSAKRDALAGRFVLIPSYADGEYGDLPVAIRRNPSLRYWLQSFAGRIGLRRRISAPDYQAPEVDVHA